jgi:hypothetical protein
MRNRRPGGRAPLERERGLVSGLVALLLLLWLGFAVHRSPRFPGSLAGNVLAISGAALLVFPSLAYLAVKRVSRLKRYVSVRVPLRRLLAWHLYGGLFGSALAILHTGHRFESTVGIALTGLMLLSVFSGYLGRHFLGLVSLELHEKQALLGQLATAYNELAGQLAVRPEGYAAIALPRRRWLRFLERLGTGRTVTEGSFALGYRATQLAGSIADLEYAIKAHEQLKRRLTAWLLVHIAASLGFYVLLALHVWASVYFGLRWLT